MPAPEHLWRFPTSASIEALAQRFRLPNTPAMQDWQWEVADADRLDEFLEAYDSGALDDDERFTLMEIILQSFEELLAGGRGLDARWERTLDLVDRNIDIHAFSVWYWADPDGDGWLLTPHLRAVLERQDPPSRARGRTGTKGSIPGPFALDLRGRPPRR